MHKNEIKYNFYKYEPYKSWLWLYFEINYITSLRYHAHGTRGRNQSTIVIKSTTGIIIACGNNNK